MYSRQIKMITDYIKSGEKSSDNMKLGVEIEHFVIHNDSLETVSYYGDNGVESTLKQIVKNNWKAKFEGNHLLGLDKDDLSVTLEPGSQLEISIGAKIKIKEIEDSYFKFLDEVLPILHEKNQSLVALGYHPQSKIEDIKLLPKKRYDLMFNYFKSRGSHAHNMMKGTGAFQISIDYLNELDYIKKFRIINALSPVFYALFENAFFFEGEPCKIHNLRSFIWQNCDDERSGTVKESLEEDYSYSKYAEYILNRTPIFTIRDGKIIPTHDKKVKDILDPDKTSLEELEHLLSMFFPDARTKKYIEIRMMDSIPYPLNMSAVALVKGIFYIEDNLNEVYNYIKDIDYNQVIKYKADILDNGIFTKFKDSSILEVGVWLVDMVKNSLGEESKYLEPLEELLEKELNPYLFTKAQFSNNDKKEAIKWTLIKR